MKPSPQRIVTLSPSARDKLMANHAYELAKAISCSPRLHDYQRFSLAKLVCILANFPNCPIDEWISVDLELGAVELENWIYEERWSIGYEGKTAEEPHIRFSSSISYRERSSLQGETKCLLVWVIPLVPNWPVGTYRSFREEVPFIDQLGDINTRIEELYTKLSYENPALLECKITTHDNLNCWDTRERIVQSKEEQDEIEANLRHYLSDSHEIEPSCEEVIIERLGANKYKGFEQSIRGDELFQCSECNAACFDANAFVQVCFQHGRKYWLCPECWNDCYFEEDPDILLNIFIRDQLGEEIFADWKLKAILDSETHLSDV